MSHIAALDENYSVFPFTMDEGIASRAAIGLIVLASEQTMEYEWRQIIRMPGVAFFESRIANAREITPQTLVVMEQDIAAATDLIEPMSLQVVAFGCTSGAVVIGEDQVTKRIREVRPDAAVTTPITGAVEGLRSLQTNRIALVTPYVESVNRMFIEYLSSKGFAVNRIVTFNNSNDNEVARIDGASIRAAVLDAGRYDDVDAVFISCTSLRTVYLLQKLEEELSKPIVASNSAMAWHALRLSGIGDSIPQFGRLFEIG